MLPCARLDQDTPVSLTQVHEKRSIEMVRGSPMTPEPHTGTLLPPQCGEEQLGALKDAWLANIVSEVVKSYRQGKEDERT